MVSLYVKYFFYSHLIIYLESLLLSDYSFSFVSDVDEYRSQINNVKNNLIHIDFGSAPSYFDAGQLVI